MQEAKAASALNHPNIVTIHDIDTADGVTFIAMEFVKGGTLGRLIRDKSIESLDGRFVYYNGPNASIWKVPAAGGEAARVLMTGFRAQWTLSAFGIYVVDPDASGGPAIGPFPFAAKRREVLRLPGEPDSYVDRSGGRPVVSPDGQWILYSHIDRTEAQLMLVENFR